MRTIKILLVAMTGAAVLCGCGDSQSQQASRDLLEEVRQVQDQYAQALALMSNAVFRSDSRDIPLVKPLEGPIPRQGQPVTVLPVHPQVVTILAEAQTRLRNAMTRHSNALPADLALANALMGQIQMLQAQYQLRLADAAGQQVLASMAGASGAISLLSFEADQAAFWAHLGQLDEPQILEELRQAQQKQQQIAQQAQDLQQQIQQLCQQRDALYQTNAELTSRARQLRIDSQLASGRKGLELAQQAIQIEADANRNELEAASLDFRQERLGTQWAELDGQIQSFQARQELAQGVLKNIEQSRAQRQQIQAQQRQQVAGLQEQVNSSMVQLDQALDRLGAHQRQAGQFYEAAAAAFKLAQAKKGAADAMLLSQEASARMALAELEARQSRLGAEVSALADRAAATRQAAASAVSAQPAAAPVALDYPPTDRQELAQQAQQNYQTAAQLYQRAMSPVSASLRWVYQGQQAAAYLGLYRLTGDVEALDNARRVLSEALQGRQASPYLAPVHGLSRMAQEMAEQAPAPATAPAGEEQPSGQAVQPGDEEETAVQPAAGASEEEE